MKLLGKNMKVICLYRGQSLKNSTCVNEFILNIQVFIVFIA
jgi:hypothetical protein